MSLTRVLFALEITLIAVGLPLAGFAYWQSRFALANIGFLVLGAGALIGGLETMVTRSIHIRHRTDYTASYRGLAASGWGLTFVAMGIALLLFGAVEGAGDEQRIIALVLQRPSGALLPFGLFLLGTGLAVLGGPLEGRRTGIERIMAIGDKAPSLILFLLSTATLGIGLFELLAPTAFDNWLRRLTGLD